MHTRHFNEGLEETDNRKDSNRLTALTLSFSASCAPSFCLVSTSSCNSVRVFPPQRCFHSGIPPKEHTILQSLILRRYCVDLGVHLCCRRRADLTESVKANSKKSNTSKHSKDLLWLYYKCSPQRWMLFQVCRLSLLPQRHDTCNTALMHTHRSRALRKLRCRLEGALPVNLPQTYNRMHRRIKVINRITQAGATEGRDGVRGSR